MALENVPNVSKVAYHIACSATTKSELVVPIVSADDELVAVLDIDSDTAAAFDETDELYLQRVNRYFQGGSG